ncbi:MAG: DUF4250 domain-containing protein [Lachnospiraceae bacterium]|nr:DUF4250 domain-containing protein [Lachnospiraceae bacterium]
MELPKDPVMLYSVINLKLRDFYADLDALCEDLDLDRAELEQALSAAGFRYDADTNRFL